MPLPIIDHTQSVPGFLQWQEFAFQPFAFNAPTGWTSSALPPGLSLNASTGRVTGAVTVPGIYNVGFRATNASGTSETVVFTFGIEPSGGIPPSSLIETHWDLITGLVTFPGLAAEAILPLKRGDDVIFHVFLKKGDLVIDLPMLHVKFALKVEEPSTTLVTSSGWRRRSAGSSAAYQVHIKLDSTPLTDALFNATAPGDATTPRPEFLKRLTAFDALGEFELREDSEYYNDVPAFGPASLRKTSQTFPVWIVRDMVPDA